MKFGKIKYLSIIFCLFLLSLLYAGCVLKEYESVDPNSVITLSNLRKDDKIKANGVEEITFEAKIHEDSAQRTITFETTSGTFIDTVNSNTIDVIANNEGKAIATLKVGITPGKFEVIATISGYRVREKFTLYIAYAEKIEGKTSTRVVKKDGSINAVLTAFLSRKEGFVSIGSNVDFSATQQNDQNQEVPVGRFIGTGTNSSKTNENGIATITFAADTGDVIAGKIVNIKMVTKIENNDGSTSTLEDSLTLDVIDVI